MIGLLTSILDGLRHSNEGEVRPIECLQDVLLLDVNVYCLQTSHLAVSPVLVHGYAVISLECIDSKCISHMVCVSYWCR